MCYKLNCVYFLYFENYPYIKIGKSNNFFNRKSSLEKIWGKIIKEKSFIIKLDKKSDINRFEKMYHLYFQDYKVDIYENSNMDGHDEMFHCKYYDYYLDKVKNDAINFQFDVIFIDDFYNYQKNDMLDEIQSLDLYIQDLRKEKESTLYELEELKKHKDWNKSLYNLIKNKNKTVQKLKNKRDSLYGEIKGIKETKKSLENINTSLSENISDKLKDDYFVVSFYKKISKSNFYNAINVFKSLEGIWIQSRGVWAIPNHNKEKLKEFEIDGILFV